MSSLLIRQDLAPVVVGYLLIMGTLAVGLRMLRRPASAAYRPRQVPGALRRPGPGWPRLIARLLGTAVGGYLTLMAVVVLYYYGAAHVGGQFVPSAFTGCALLLGLSIPVFLAASWLAERTGRRPGAGPIRRRPGPGARAAGARSEISQADAAGAAKPDPDTPGDPHAG